MQMALVQLRHHVRYVQPKNNGECIALCVCVLIGILKICRSKSKTQKATVEMMVVV